MPGAPTHYLVFNAFIQYINGGVTARCIMNSILLVFLASCFFFLNEEDRKNN